MAKTSITPKQAQIKLNSLLKGLDNSALVLNKHKEQITKSVKEISVLVTGLANPKTAKAKTVKPVKPAKVKAAKTAKVAKVAKVKAVKPAKVAKVAKPEKPAKVVKEAAPVEAVAKPTKPAKTNPPPVAGRPILKEAIKGIIADAKKPLPASDIWHRAVEKYGYWSRQSCYNALDDSKTFSKSDEGFSVRSANGVADDDEADQFVDSIEKAAPAAAVSTVQ